MERGNKVVLFDKVPGPLRPGSRILYESYAAFANFVDLQALPSCMQTSTAAVCRGRAYRELFIGASIIKPL